MLYEYKISRSTCVSARDVPVMLGISPFQSREELLLEKCNYKRKKPFTESMKRGVILEPVAMGHFCKQMNFDPDDIEYPGFTRHKKYDFIGGVPDGIYKNSLIEIKCPSKFTEKPVVFYEQQMQVYMQIFDIDTCYYVEYIENIGLKIKLIYRDNLWWKWVTPSIKCFWTEVEYWRENGITKYPKYSHILSSLITAE